MFNPVVKAQLENHLIRPYVLNQSGASMVYDSNEGLADEYFDHLEFPISDFWYAYFVDKINILQPKHYGNSLDICAGTGTVCLNLMRKGLFQNCEAIDISETAIKILQQRISKNKIANLNASCVNIMKTDYPNNHFNCIFGNSFLHHLPDNELFLKEMFRILQFEGTICFTSEPTKSAFTLETFFVRNAFKLLQFLRLKPYKRNEKLNAPLSDIWLYDEETVKKMLDEVGFICVSIKGFGFLTPLFNGPFTILFQKISKKSMQPDWWWNLFTALDKILFFWLPNSFYSHYTISAKKPFSS